MKHEAKGIAVVGAGLAGLTAAHFLHKWRSTLPITIFEASHRNGGRLFTSRKPPGEHGARYLLGSELDVYPGSDYWRDYSLPDGTTIAKLLKDYRVKLSPMGRDWPHCCTLRPLIFKRLTPSGRQLKSHFPAAARIIRKLHVSQAVSGSFKEWVKQNLFTSKNQGGHQASFKIIKMILAGETCAPWSHLSAQYALECLASAVSKEKWFIIKKGSEHLIAAISKPVAKSIKRRHHCLKVRRSERNSVAVEYRTANGIRTSYFQGVIVASPNGDALVEQNSMKRHSHSYISILLEFDFRPELRNDPHINLHDGLYIDDPFVNYLELEAKKPKWILRILVPNAERFEYWSDGQINKHCRKVLETLGMPRKLVESPTISIKHWEEGLPCGGTRRKFEKVSEGIYLCGDRYGRWPSMAGAMVSGARAADALMNDLDL
jgi:phytoene dehydrogenase-like protein